MLSKPARLAAVIAVAAIAVVAAIALSSSGAQAPPPTPAEALVVDGLPERGGVLGDPAAPVTVTEFVDLQCPVCAAASREILPTLIDEHVRPGRVNLQLRRCPSSARTPSAPPASRTARSVRGGCGRSSRRSTRARAPRTRAT